MSSTADNYPFFQTILREFSEILRIPVVIILIAMILFSMFCIGWIIVEAVKDVKKTEVVIAPTYLAAAKVADVNPGHPLEGPGRIHG